MYMQMYFCRCGGGFFLHTGTDDILRKGIVSAFVLKMFSFNLLLRSQNVVMYDLLNRQASDLLFLKWQHNYLRG